MLSCIGHWLGHPQIWGLFSSKQQMWVAWNALYTQYTAPPPLVRIPVHMSILLNLHQMVFVFKSNWILYRTIYGTNPLQKFVCIKLLIIWPLFTNWLFFALVTWEQTQIQFSKVKSQTTGKDWLGKIDAVNSFAQFWPQTDVRQECAKILTHFVKISRIETDDWDGRSDSWQLK